MSTPTIFILPILEGRIEWHSIDGHKERDTDRERDGHKERDGQRETQREACDDIDADEADKETDIDRERRTKREAHTALSDGFLPHLSTLVFSESLLPPSRLLRPSP